MKKKTYKPKRKKIKTHKIIIRAKDSKPSYGHQDRTQHMIHADKRKRKSRTRAGQKLRWMRDQ